jgi:hypothetical protein
MPYFPLSTSHDGTSNPTNDGHTQQPRPTGEYFFVATDRSNWNGVNGLSAQAEQDGAALTAHVLVRTVGLSREETAAIRRTIPEAERQTAEELTNRERAAFILAWQDEIKGRRRRTSQPGVEPTVPIAQYLGLQFPDYPTRFAVQPETVYLAALHEEDVRDDVLLLLQELDYPTSISPYSQYRISERVSVLLGTETPALASYRHLIEGAAPVFDPTVTTSWGDAGVPTPYELFGVYHDLRVLTHRMVCVDAVSAMIQPFIYPRP